MLIQVTQADIDKAKTPEAGVQYGARCVVAQALRRQLGLNHKDVLVGTVSIVVRKGEDCQRYIVDDVGMDLIRNFDGGLGIMPTTFIATDAGKLSMQEFISMFAD